MSAQLGDAFPSSKAVTKMQGMNRIAIARAQPPRWKTTHTSISSSALRVCYRRITVNKTQHNNKTIVLSLTIYREFPLEKHTHANRLRIELHSLQPSQLLTMVKGCRYHSRNGRRRRRCVIAVQATSCNRIFNGRECSSHRNSSTFICRVGLR